MIVHPDFIWVNNPHTGSRTMKFAFGQLGFEMPNGAQHHVHPSYIPLDDRPVITMIREPVSWALAFYYDFYPHTSWDTFMNRKLQTLQWSHDRLNIYSGVATHYCIYEEGLEAAFEKLNLVPVAPLKRCGNHDHVREEVHNALPKDYKEQIRERFKEDVIEYDEAYSCNWSLP